jgi:hypothetical protein
MPTSLRVTRCLEITTTTTIVVREMFPPAAPVVLSNTFSSSSSKGSSMAQRVGTVKLSRDDPTVTKQPVIISGSSVAGQNPITVDAMDPAATFEANDGDVLTEIATQINPTGPSPESLPYTIIVAPGTVDPTPPAIGVLPLAPVILSNTFV